jgi:hypothetical protein
MNKSMRMGQTGHISHMEEVRNGFTILVIKPEWKRPFGKSRHRWDSMKIGKQGLGVCTTFICL